MRVLGIEGTAWAASAAVYDSDADSNVDDVLIETEAYQPDTGGLHPREAAEHMREFVPTVIERVLEGSGKIDAVAFSRGPGLGPCLRIAGTAARALAGRLDVPLVGVNHMLAHFEIGRHRSGFDAPLCLNTSGANAHVLGYRNGRYRVLGETMDTGLGNALDKFARHLDWSHPGGPKIETRAREGDYIDLPYVVRGMDFSFSGLLSAAKAAADDNDGADTDPGASGAESAPIEDVCFSLQENAFGMVTEVTERALSLTGRDQLVLGGGVAQNRRLHAMLKTMCEQRGAALYVPEDRFLRDNAGMIAVLGAKMLAAGDTIEISDSGVRPDFRPDEVAVTWRETDAPNEDRPAGGNDTVHGAEAVVEIEGERVHKRRVPKEYRHPALDARLRRERTVAEARLTSEARRHGVPTPVVIDADPAEARLVFERVGSADLREAVSASRVRAVAVHLATLHVAGLVHGDPTTRNVRIGTRRVEPEDRASDTDGRTYLIDFGLGYYTDAIEDHAMDLHVFEGALAGTADESGELQTAFERAYREAGDLAVLDRLREIEGRGRYR